MENVTLRRSYKDVLFRRVFSDKESLLELYNAVNGTNYADPEELTVVTLEDAIYMNVKNDIAFLVGAYLNLYEHQSTVNPNMPLRCLFYITREYEKLMDKTSLYSSKLQEIPTPRFLVFYNGKRGQPERQTLQLSAAFRMEEENPELELRVTVLNINYGKNKGLLKQCKKLEEYALFVDMLRRNALKYSIEEAAHRTVEECIRQDILRELLREQRAEVIAMSIFYYDEEKELELIRRDEYDLGHEAGKQEGMEEGKREGIAEGRLQGVVSSIMALLADLGKIPEYVHDRLLEETREDQMNRWLRLAAKAGSIEEFSKEFDQTLY